MIPEVVGVPGQAFIMMTVEEHRLLHVHRQTQSWVMTQGFVEPCGAGATGTDGQEG